MTDRTPGTVLSDAFRLSVGTLSAFPVPPPRQVDAQRAGLAMMLAPLAALVAGFAGFLVATVAMLAGLSATVAAVLAVATLTLATRGMHLDGLADTADGLAASYQKERALAAMRTGDTGPAGVSAVVLVLLLQAAALAQALNGIGPVVVVMAVLIGRTPLAVACSRGIPAARDEGLGATVAGSVSRLGAALSVFGATVAAAGIGALTVSVFVGSVPPGFGLSPVAPSLSLVVLATVAAMFAALIAATVLTARAVARFGGITGDVLGAVVEIGTTAALLALAVLVG